MTRKEFKDFFPLRTYYRDTPTKVIGAYDFLRHKEYKRQADYIEKELREITFKYRDGEDSEPREIETRDRRRLVVGVILERGLLDDFLKECWREEHAPFACRKERMEKWYEDYKHGYKSRYGRFLG